MGLGTYLQTGYLSPDRDHSSHRTTTSLYLLLPSQDVKTTDCITISGQSRWFVDYGFEVLKPTILMLWHYG